MTGTIKIYGRWNEDSNWQLEEVRKKDFSEEEKNELEFLGYTFCERYNEYSLVNGSRLRKIVITF